MMTRDGAEGIEHDSVEKDCNMKQRVCRARLRISHLPVEKARYYGYFTYLGHLADDTHESGTVDFRLSCASAVVAAECSGLLP